MARHVPVLMRLLPDRLKAAVWARWYHLRAERWQPLFQNAPLRFAPGFAMDLVPGDVVSGCIAFTGFWELDHSRELRRLARRGGTMIDVGANLGYFSLLWAAASSQNRCVAFEASPRTVSLLRHNVATNGCEPRIQVLPLAAGRETGRLDFDLGPPDQLGWGGLVAASTSTTVPVDVVRIDEVLDRGERIALLKIDIEGADTWALMGCEELLKNRLIDCIWFEQHRPRMRALGIGLEEAQVFLRRLGYLASPRSDATGEVVDWHAVPARGPASGLG